MPGHAHHHHEVDSGEVDCDVLVVGAGPVGLTVAAALAHHGVDAAVVDAREEPRSQSRANNLYARPQELLATVGLREPLAQDAHAVTNARFVLNGRSIDQARFDDVASPYPTVLYSSQATIERTLRGLLARQGRPVQGGVTVEGLEQDPDGVTVHLVHADGHRATRRARWVVGADGQGSTVREAAGLGLDVEHFPDRATRQIDATLSWRRPTTPDTLWFFLYDTGFAGVMPIAGDVHRVFFVEDDALVPDREPTLAEAQQRAREVTGDPTLTLSDPVWASRTAFAHGVANAHRAGRVLLAGDAGHLNLPIGGQGMNAGLQDAVALAWRLAMTLAGHAAPAVLDSYATERNAEHHRLGRQQVSGFRRLMYRSRLQDTALDVAAGLVPDIGTRLLGARELHQLAVAYPDSPLSVDHRPRTLGRRALTGRTLHAGDRAPDARVVLQTETTSLFDQFHDTDAPTWAWTLLGFDADGSHTAALRSTLAAASRHPWLRPRLVRRRPDGTGTGGPVPVLWDLDGAAHAAYDAGSATLVLVRPDGHIAVLAPAHRGDALLGYCTALDPASGPGDAVPVELAS